MTWHNGTQSWVGRRGDVLSGISVLSQSQQTLTQSLPWSLVVKRATWEHPIPEQRMGSIRAASTPGHVVKGCKERTAQPPPHQHETCSFHCPGIHKLIQKLLGLQQKWEFGLHLLSITGTYWNCTSSSYDCFKLLGSTRKMQPWDALIFIFSSTRPLSSFKIVKREKIGKREK